MLGSLGEGKQSLSDQQKRGGGVGRLALEEGDSVHSSRSGSGGGGGDHLLQQQQQQQRHRNSNNFISSNFYRDAENNKVDDDDEDDEDLKRNRDVRTSFSRHDAIGGATAATAANSSSNYQFSSGKDNNSSGFTSVAEMRRGLRGVDSLRYGMNGGDSTPVMMNGQQQSFAEKFSFVNQSFGANLSSSSSLSEGGGNEETTTTTSNFSFQNAKGSTSVHSTPTKRFDAGLNSSTSAATAMMFASMYTPSEEQAKLSTIKTNGGGGGGGGGAAAFVAALDTRMKTPGGLDEDFKTRNGVAAAAGATPPPPVLSPLQQQLYHGSSSSSASVGAARPLSMDFLKTGGAAPSTLLPTTTITSSISNGSTSSKTLALTDAAKSSVVRNSSNSVKISSSSSENVASSSSNNNSSPIVKLYSSSPVSKPSLEVEKIPAANGSITRPPPPPAGRKNSSVGVSLEKDAKLIASHDSEAERALKFAAVLASFRRVCSRKMDRVTVGALLSADSVSQQTYSQVEESLLEVEECMAEASHESDVSAEMELIRLRLAERDSEVQSLSAQLEEVKGKLLLSQQQEQADRKLMQLQHEEALEKMKAEMNGLQELAEEERQRSLQLIAAAKSAASTATAATVVGNEKSIITNINNTNNNNNNGNSSSSNGLGQCRSPGPLSPPGLRETDRISNPDSVGDAEEMIMCLRKELEAARTTAHELKLELEAVSAFEQAGAEEKIRQAKIEARIETQAEVVELRSIVSQLQTLLRQNTMQLAQAMGAAGFLLPETTTTITSSSLETGGEGAAVVEKEEKADSDDDNDDDDSEDWSPIASPVAGASNNRNSRRKSAKASNLEEEEEEVEQQQQPPTASLPLIPRPSSTGSMSAPAIAAMMSIQQSLSSTSTTSVGQQQALIASEDSMVRSSQSIRDSLTLFVASVDAQRASVDDELVKLREEIKRHQSEAAEHVSFSLDAQQTMRKDLQELRILLDKKTARVNEMATERDNLLRELATCRSQLAAAVRSATAAMANNSSSLDIGKKATIEEIDATASQNEQLKLVLSETEQRLEQRESELRELHAVLAEFRHREKFAAGAEGSAAAAAAANGNLTARSAVSSASRKSGGAAAAAKEGADETLYSTAGAVVGEPQTPGSLSSSTPATDAAAAAEIQRLKDELNVARNKLADLNVEFSNAEQKLADKEESAEIRLKAQQFESKIAILETALARQTAESETALRNLTAELKQVVDERQEAMARIAAVDADREELLNLIGRKAEEFSVLRGQLAELEAVVRDKTDLYNELAMELKQEREERSREASVFNHEMNHLKQDLSQMEERLANARDDSARSAAMATAHLDAARRLAENRAIEIDACRSQIAELEEALLLAHGERETLAHALEETADNFNKAKADWEREKISGDSEKSVIISTQEVRDAEARDRILQVREREAALRREMQEMRLNLDKAIADATTANKHYQEAESEAKALRESLTSHAAVAANLQNRITRFVRRQALSKEKTRAIKDEARTTLSALEQRLAKREDELAILYARVVDRDVRYAALEDAAATGKLSLPQDRSEMPSLHLAGGAEGAAGGGASENRSSSNKLRNSGTVATGEGLEGLRSPGALTSPSMSLGASSPAPSLSSSTPAAGTATPAAAGNTTIPGSSSSSAKRLSFGNIGEGGIVSSFFIGEGSAAPSSGSLSEMVTKALTAGKKAKKRELLAVIVASEEVRTSMDEKIAAALEAAKKADDRARRESGQLIEQIKLVQESESKIRALTRQLEEGADERRDLRRKNTEAARAADEKFAAQEQQLRRTRRQCIALRKTEKTLVEQLGTLRKEAKELRSELTRLSEESARREMELLQEAQHARKECERLAKELANSYSSSRPSSSAAISSASTTVPTGLAFASSSSSHPDYSPQSTSSISDLASARQRCSELESLLREERSQSMRKEFKIAELQKKVTDALESRDAALAAGAGSSSMVAGQLSSIDLQSTNDNSSVASDDVSLKSSHSNPGGSSAAAGFVPSRTIISASATPDQLRAALAERDARVAALESKIRRLSATSKTPTTTGNNNNNNNNNISSSSASTTSSAMIDRLQSQLAAQKMAKRDLESQLSDLRLVLMAAQSTIHSQEAAAASSSSSSSSTAMKSTSAAATQLGMAARAVERLTAAAVAAEARVAAAAAAGGGDHGSAPSTPSSRGGAVDISLNSSATAAGMERRVASLTQTIGSKDTLIKQLKERIEQLEELIKMRDQLGSALVPPSVNRGRSGSSSDPEERITALMEENSRLQRVIADMNARAAKVADVRARKAALLSGPVSGGAQTKSGYDHEDSSSAPRSSAASAASQSPRGNCARCDELNRKLGICTADLARAKARAEAAEAGFVSGLGGFDVSLLSSTGGGDSFVDGSRSKDVEIARLAMQVNKLSSELDMKDGALARLQEKVQQVSALEAQVSRLLARQNVSSSGASESGRSAGGNRVITYDAATWTGPSAPSAFGNNNNSSSETVRRLQDELEEAQQTEAQLRSEIARLQQQLSNAQQRLATAESALRRAENRGGAAGGSGSSRTVDDLTRKVSNAQAAQRAADEENIALKKTCDLLRRNMLSYKEEMSHKIQVLREALLEKVEKDDNMSTTSNSAGMELRLMLEAVSDAEAVAERERNHAQSLEASRDVLIAKIQKLEQEISGGMGIDGADYWRQRLKGLYASIVARSRHTSRRRKLQLCFAQWIQETEAVKINRILDRVDDSGLPSTSSVGRALDSEDNNNIRSMLHQSGAGEWIM